MYFKINIILTIFSYQCINVAVYGEFQPEGPGRHSCFVRMPPIDNRYMPLPFQSNLTKPRIIRPDGNGNYKFKHNNHIRLSCTGNVFTAPPNLDFPELSIMCENGFLLFRGRPINMNIFKCRDIPTPSLKLTRITCQGNENNTVLEVGFQSQNAFLKSYRICFNWITKRSLYSWYYMDSPVLKINQIQLKTPKFIETRLFDGINMTEMYYGKNQVKELTRVFNSSEVAKKYLNNRFLTPGHLLSQDEFVYVSEQHATYFYENTVPHWSELNNRVWKVLERLFRRNLLRGTKRHMIAAGTYGTLTLPDSNGVEQPLYLSTYERIPVPKYIWKMDFDVDRRSGTVFIGYNHPTIPLNKTLHFCSTVPCPGSFMRQVHSDLVFCCTKDSFEVVYGVLDYYVFREF